MGDFSARMKGDGLSGDIDSTGLIDPDDLQPGGPGSAYPPTDGVGGSFLVLDPPVSQEAKEIVAQKGTANFIPD